VLTAFGNLCALTKLVTVNKRVTLHQHGRVRRILRRVKMRTAESLRMPTTITFQNGGVMEQDTPIAVTGCRTWHRAKTARNARTARDGAASERRNR
jgi:hypothetical protein